MPVFSLVYLGQFRKSTHLASPLPHIILRSYSILTCEYTLTAIYSTKIPFLLQHYGKHVYP